MIVLLRPGTPDSDRDRVLAAVRALDVPVVERPLGERHVIETPAAADACRCEIERLPGVERVFVGEPAAHLAGRDAHPANTLVHVGDAVFGGPSTVIVAGPCAVEDRDTLVEVGMFDENFTGYGHEDLELGYRLLAVRPPVRPRPIFLAKSERWAA